MRHVQWLLALAALVLAVAQVRAQGFVVVNPYVGVVESGFGFGGAEFGISYRHKHLGLSLRAAGYNGYGVGIYSFSPYLAGPGYMIVQRGPFIGGVVVPPPVLPFAGPFGPNAEFDARVADMIARQRALLDPLPPKEGPIIVKAEPKEDKPPKADKPLPGEEAGKFRPIRPEDREKAKDPIRPDKPRPDPGRDDGLPGEPKGDPKTEAARLIRLGREAYAQEGYGRAVQRFRQAAESDPKNAQAQLLLGEALFAIAKYREAVEAIQRGLALDPNWPKSPFRPLELYGVNVADYADHMLLLDTSLAMQPNDRDLLFLTGYQLWFDGRKDEARRMFQQAVRQGANQAMIQLFLNLMPDLPVV